MAALAVIFLILVTVWLGFIIHPLLGIAAILYWYVSYKQEMARQAAVRQYLRNQQ